ncbi:MAG: transposase domain-containing protein, partial [Clostridia bacterium]|nr:transposase domain-containing protein [Clostridia bacterium]
TAKANGLDVLKYLNYVFRRIPIPDGNPTDDFIESLMPWNEAVRAECQCGYI